MSVPVVLDRCTVAVVGVGRPPSMVISLVEEGRWEAETHQQAKVDTPSRAVLSLDLPLSPTLGSYY
jgi:hypothetical protein